MYSPRNITQEEARAYEARIVKLLAIISPEAKRLGLKNYELRKRFVAGRHNFTFAKEAGRAMQELVNLEVEIINSFMAISNVHKLANAFFMAESRPGMTLDDFIQEAMMAMVKAIYAYRGRWAFSTLAHYCIKNRLKDFAMKQTFFARIPRAVIVLRGKVRKKMVGKVTFDEAIAQIETEMEKKLSKRLISKCYQAMVKPVHVEAESELPQMDKQSLPIEQMKRALEKADLTPLEREVVTAYLQIGRGYQVALAKQKGCSRAWIGNKFKTAREKMLRAYEVIAAAS